MVHDGGHISWYRREGDAGGTGERMPLILQDPTDAEKEEAERLFLLSDRLTREGDAEEAFEICREAAILGNARAQAHLGIMYHFGDGTPADASCAFQWFRLSASHGDPHGQFGLAACYRVGEGTAPDPVSAFSYYRAAALQDLPEAFTHYGTCLQYGIGTAPDAQEAQVWYEKAIEHDVPGAKTLLATVYEASGDRARVKQAFLLYREAAETGEKEARYRLGRMYFFGPDEYVQGKDRVLGVGFERDHRKALECFKEVCAESFEAVYLMGQCYEMGLDGVEQDLKEARECYRAAASSGCAYAAEAQQWLDEHPERDA